MINIDDIITEPASERYNGRMKPTVLKILRMLAKERGASQAAVLERLLVQEYRKRLDDPVETGNGE